MCLFNDSLKHFCQWLYQNNMVFFFLFKYMCVVTGQSKIDYTTRHLPHWVTLIFSALKTNYKETFKNKSTNNI